MKYIFFTLIVFLLASVTAVSQDQLIVEVTTDKYPEENKWVLYDIESNVVFTKDVLESETVNRDTITLDANTCYFWRIFDDYGDGMAAEGANGGFKLYLNNTLINESTESNFGDSASVFGIGSVCIQTDASVERLTFSTQQTFDPFYVSASVLNVGTKTIESIKIAYAINDVLSNELVINDLNLEPGLLMDLVHDEIVEFSESGDYNMSFQIISVNGEADENTVNNKLSQDIFVASGFHKIPMHELYTSSTCPPCVQGNIVLDDILSEHSTEEYTLIKYQVNWPGSGDPYYTPDVGRMKTMYAVSAVPTLYVNLSGSNPATYSEETFNDYAQEKTDIGLSMETHVVGDSVYATVRVRASREYSDDLFLRLALLEKTTYNNASTNGETEFHNVFMKFITEEWTGADLGTFTNGESKSFTYVSSVDDTFIEELSDLRVAGYVFEENNYAILQSDMVEALYTAVEPVITFNIPDASIEIDTFPTIEIISSRPLYNADSTYITNVSDVITFKKGNLSGEDVPFTGSYNNAEQSFTIQPESVLDLETVYIVELHDVVSNEGFLVQSASSSFTTLKNDDQVGVNQDLDYSSDLYPNPVNNVLNINVKANAVATVFNISGQVIGNQVFLKLGNNSIDLSHLEPGVYLVKVKTNNRIEEHKIIKL